MHIVITIIKIFHKTVTETNHAIDRLQRSQLSLLKVMWLISSGLVPIQNGHKDNSDD